MNGFPETELPRRLKETPELRFLVVAEKYQTSFDEPALCAIYVDRKLAGLQAVLQAVQTLSRINRTHSRFPNKRTFVLDFQNTMDDIQEAFKPYFEATELSDVTDPNQVYELYNRLLKFLVIDRSEVQRFAETYFGGMLSETGGPPRIEYELTEEGERTYIDLLRTALTSRDPAARPTRRGSRRGDQIVAPYRRKPRRLDPSIDLTS